MSRFQSFSLSLHKIIYLQYYLKYRCQPMRYWPSISFCWEQSTTMLSLAPPFYVCTIVGKILNLSEAVSLYIKWARNQFHLINERARESSWYMLFSLIHSLKFFKFNLMHNLFCKYKQNKYMLSYKFSRLDIFPENTTDNLETFH